jgi:hypothetical protein
MFHIFSNIFSLISNKVLISLHSCVDLTHTNCPVTTHGVFNFFKSTEFAMYLYTFIFTIHFKFRFHRCVLYDEMNKARSHLHIF